MTRSLSPADGETGNPAGIAAGGDSYVGDAPGEMGSSLSYLDYGAGTPAPIMAAGYYSVCAGTTIYTSEVSVACWGHNHESSLGQSTPQQVFGGPQSGILQMWTGLSVRSRQSCETACPRVLMHAATTPYAHDTHMGMGMHMYTCACNNMHMTPTCTCNVRVHSIPMTPRAIV